jgi:hypothetical protein
MNFELADKLTELLDPKKLDNAIDSAENELKKSTNRLSQNHR